MVRKIFYFGPQQKKNNNSYQIIEQIWSEIYIFGYLFINLLNKIYISGPRSYVLMMLWSAKIFSVFYGPQAKKVWETLP